MGVKGTEACGAFSTVWAQQTGVNCFFPSVTCRLNSWETLAKGFTKGSTIAYSSGGTSYTTRLFIAQKTEEISSGGGIDGRVEARPRRAGVCKKRDSTKELDLNFQCGPQAGVNS